MNNLVRLTVILIVLVAAMLLTLFVAGVLDSNELWNNMSKVLQFVGIFFGASLAIMFIAKK